MLCGGLGAIMGGLGPLFEGLGAIFGGLGARIGGSVVLLDASMPEKSDKEAEKVVSVMSGTLLEKLNDGQRRPNAPQMGAKSSQKVIKKRSLKSASI